MSILSKNHIVSLVFGVILCILFHFFAVPQFLNEVQIVFNQVGLGIYAMCLLLFYAVGEVQDISEDRITRAF